MAQATMIVPPVYEAQLFGRGFTAAAISARRVYLYDANLQPSVKVPYNKFDAVEQMSFRELVDFALNRQLAN